jgi:hypothetical protein
LPLVHLRLPQQSVVAAQAWPELLQTQIPAAHPPVPQQSVLELQA